MKASELNGMSDEQLVLTLSETEKHLFQLRFQSATDRLETPSEISKAKKDIARIRSIQRARELAKLAEVSDIREIMRAKAATAIATPKPAQSTG